MQVTEPAVGEWCQRLQLAFVLEEDILSTRCNKDDVVWYVVTFKMQLLPILFVVIQLIIFEPTHGLSSMNSLL